MGMHARLEHACSTAVVSPRPRKKSGKTKPATLGHERRTHHKFKRQRRLLSTVTAATKVSVWAVRGSGARAER